PVSTPDLIRGGPRGGKASRLPTRRRLSSASSGQRFYRLDASDTRIRSKGIERSDSITPKASNSFPKNGGVLSGAVGSARRRTVAWRGCGDDRRRLRWGHQTGDDMRPSRSAALVLFAVAFVGVALRPAPVHSQTTKVDVGGHK